MAEWKALGAVFCCLIALRFASPNCLNGYSATVQSGTYPYGGKKCICQTIDMVVGEPSLYTIYRQDSQGFASSPMPGWGSKAAHRPWPSEKS